MKDGQVIKAAVAGKRTERLPFMPISMCIAADGIGAKYRDYAMDWRLLARGQLAFAEAFGADHVSAISDPCVEASDLGASIVAPEDQPPGYDEAQSLLADKSAFRLLVSPGGRGAARLGPSSIVAGPRMENRLRAVRELALQAGEDLLVEGWVEGPCAESADLRGLTRLMLDFYDDPDFVHELVAFVAQLETAFALAQVSEGADIVGVGDAASSLVGPEIFAEFFLDAHRAYVEAIHGAGALARLHICGNSSPLLSLVRDLGYDIVDLDFMVDMAEARSALGARPALCGNLDPVRLVKDGSAEAVRERLGRIEAALSGSPWIVGAGCEIPRGTSAANILAMRDFAHRETSSP
jgi:uroporphyrinogen-III decarboxylase